MKKKLLFCALLCLIPSLGWAYVTDAPHNETNGVTCGNCHTYSLWWAYSPTTSSDPYYGQYTDDVCNSCHDNDDRPDLPRKTGHTPASMADSHKELNGPWTTKCVDCHDPHQQAQLAWASDNATWADDLFLVTGKVEFADVVPDGNTTITFYPNHIQPNVNDNWPTWDDPENPDPDNLILTWETKNRFSKRGLIFVHDTTLFTNTYSIISVDSLNNQIVLRGEPDANSPIDDNATFGLIYGQLIKQYIDTPNSGTRAVKFFDPENLYGPGGFVDDNDTVPATTTPEGICQVCHTISNYWHNDGTIVNTARFFDPENPEATIPDDHHSDKPCTKCHETNLGFKPTGADHSFFSSTDTSCANCHSDQEDSVKITHRDYCNHCHTDDYPNLQSYIAPRSDNKWPSYPHTPGDCTDCHNGRVGGVRNIKANFASHLKAFDDDDNASNGFDGHKGQIVVSSNCTNICHFHNNKDIVLEIHVGIDSPQDPCVKCHTLNLKTPLGSFSGAQMLLMGSYSGTGALRRGAGPGTPSCEDCHTDVRDRWKDGGGHNSNHDDQLVGVPACTRCHAGDVIDTVHKLNCGLCHDISVGTRGALIGIAAELGPGDCNHCHGDDFFLHKIAKFKVYSHKKAGDVTGSLVGYGTIAREPDGSSPDCMRCHVEADVLDENGDVVVKGTDMIYGIHTPLDLIVDPLNPFNICTTCHDGNGFLIGSASGHGLNDAGFGAPNTCSTCHQYEKTNPHPVHIGDAAMNGSVMPTDRCVNCHIGPRTENVHNNDCLLCHKNKFREGTTALVDGLPEVNIDPEDPTHRYLECVECHVDLGVDFFAADMTEGAEKDHWRQGNHVGQVDWSPGCNSATCHGGNPATGVHYWAGTCVACHAYDGALLGSAALVGSISGFDTGKAPPPGFSINCITCHGNFILHDSSTIDYDHAPSSGIIGILPTQSCLVAGCHPEPDLVREVHDKQGCSTCHAPTGELVGSAAANPYGGECIECHTAYFDGHLHGSSGAGANSHYVNEGTDESSGQLCANCHTTGNWFEILNEHTILSNGGCTTCHSSTRSSNLEPAIVDANGDGNTTVADVIFLGGSANHIHCLPCHANVATFEHYCGNGNIDSILEECDDNNTLSGDGCSSSCQLE